MLGQAQRILDTEYVAVFGVRDSSGNFYSYHLQELAFSPETVEQGGGRVRPYIYEFLAESGQGLLTTRIAIAYIPDTDLAEQSMTYWLLPNTVKERETESPAKRAKAGVGVVATEQTCYYSIRISSRAIIFALAYCESNDVVVTPSGGGGGGGGRNDDRPQWNWPSDPDCQRNMWGERDCDGGGGGGRNSCPPPYRCNNEDQPSCDLRQILRPAGCEDPEEEQPGPEPCRGDPIKDMELVSPGLSGLNGARFHPDALTSPRKDFVTGLGRVHNGIDLACNIGGPIFAPHSGVIEIVGTQINSQGIGYGNFIRVNSNINGQSINWGIAHMEENNGLVSNGQNISAGDIIGMCGISGRGSNPSTASHIHMEYGTKKVFVKKNSSSFLNPEDFLATEFDGNGKKINNSKCN